MVSLDDEWKQFLYMSGYEMSYIQTKIIQEKNTVVEKDDLNVNINDNIKANPKILNHDYELLISTKTKVVFLNRPIDIQSIFWKINIIDYWNPTDGVIKKQMKVVFKTIEEYEIYKTRLENIRFYNENIIKQINNPLARSIKFKDERKITIGLSKKDIMVNRGKRKNAFYNCFALIIRFKFENVFREVHIKVFNTGKMEIPGVVNHDMFQIVKTMILNIIHENSDVHTPLYFVENSIHDNVLINSNFNCGFHIHRDRLYKILCSLKYGIETSYDPCSYPGVKCKYYFCNKDGFDIEKQNGCVLEEDNILKMNELYESKKYTEVSFMIFRTGSCLIVGNCSEKILRFIFEFIKKLLTAEYENICVFNETPILKIKKDKVIKKTMKFSSDHFNDVQVP
jgi:hypothetical protein